MRPIPRRSVLALFSVILFFAAMISTDDAAAQDRYAAPRERMLAEIAAMARETARETGRARFSERVMEAMARVPRHRFVPAAQERSAYDNRALPIAEGQTISQPYIVALMTELLDPKPSDVVLEVGTGSGYQAAVLATLVGKVYTIELLAPLARQAAQTLQALGYANVVTRIGDGYGGWPEAAPFDAILVTAAAPGVPQPLIDQLKPGGRMVIPVDSRPDGQELVIIDKKPDGSTVSRKTLRVRFVPLIRK